MKKKKSLLILLLFSIIIQINSQEKRNLNFKIDSLENLKKDLNKKIEELNNVKKGIEDEILSIKSKIEKSKIEKDSLKYHYTVALNFNGGLKDEPGIFGNKIIEIEKNDSIKIYNWYKKYYFKASYKGKVGYVFEEGIKIDKKLIEYIVENLKKNDTKLAYLVDEYGLKLAYKLNSGSYWRGMTKKMAIDGVGKPDEINKTTGSWGIHEQWVYRKKNIYLYFENGKLTSYQD